MGTLPRSVGTRHGLYPGVIINGFVVGSLQELFFDLLCDPPDLLGIVAEQDIHRSFTKILSLKFTFGNLSER